MANSVLVSNSLDGGQVKEEFFTLSYVPASIYDKEIFTVEDNVKTSLQVGGVAYTLTFKDYNPVFTPSNSDIAVGFTTLTPVTYEMADKISYAALRTAWQADKMKPGPWEDYLGTPQMQSWFEDWLIKKGAIGHESLYVVGKKNIPDVNMPFSANYAGLLPLQRATTGVIKPKLDAAIFNKSITAITTGATTAVTVDAVTNVEIGDYFTIVGVTGADAANVNGVAGQIMSINGLVVTLNVVTTGTTFTYTNAKARFINRSNVNEALMLAWALTPESIKESEALRVQIPTHISEAYGYRQGFVTPQGGVDLTQSKPKVFNDKNLISQTRFEPNTISISLQTNNFLACDKTPESAALNVVDFRQTTMDEFIGYKVVFKSIVGIINPTEHVILSPLN